MSSDPSAEVRLTELEVRYTLQKELLDELSGVLYEQRRLIDGLLKRLEALERRAQAEGGVERAIDPEADVPPHY